MLHIFRQFGIHHLLQKSSYLWDTKTLQDQWPMPGQKGDAQQKTAYSLKRWPEINTKLKNANNYRALSLLSHGPVSFENLKRCMRGNVSDTVYLLQYLERRGVLEIMHTEWKVSDQSLKQTLGDVWLH